VPTPAQLLVNAAKNAAAKKIEQESKVDLSAKSVGQLKRMEMEQQVRILTLEKELNNARMVLSTMRKVPQRHGLSVVAKPPY